MTTYKVKTGHDQALVDLADIAPQARSTGIRYTKRTYSADGAVHTAGPYVELEFDLVGNATQYLALLTQFGLHASLNADVTVYVKDDLFAWGRYNGVAVRPETGREVVWTRFFPRRIVILVKELAKL